VLALPLLMVALAVKLTSPGPVLYWSDRVGRHNRIFRMPKFRSMRTDTPAVATHLLQDPDAWLTPIGAFLRKTSLDELPQLWSILAGDMSIVGPRPALFNQDDLIALRSERGVHELAPGLTGWAQVNGRDELPIPQKVELDVEYLRRRSFLFDLRIVWLTVIKVLRRDGVSH
jgi:O-antigen biosynthesis protein WbqP